MRQAYAHEAVVELDPAADEAEPGAVITRELCGHPDHAPPCPLAPHHTSAARDDAGRLRLRILFAVPAHRQDEVRMRIDRALAARWPLVSSGCTRLAPDEKPHARRLLHSTR